MHSSKSTIEPGTSDVEDLLERVARVEAQLVEIFVRGPLVMKGYFRDPPRRKTFCARVAGCAPAMLGAAGA